jgi:hypothetical protein
MVTQRQPQLHFFSWSPSLTPAELDERRVSTGCEGLAIMGEGVEGVAV